MRSGGAAAMIMGVCLVGFTCQFSPDDLAKPDRPSHAEQVRHDVAQSGRIMASRDSDPSTTAKDGTSHPHASKDGLDKYERITKQIEEDVKNGYTPPAIGTETESDAQARVLRNCRAGFTGERAPATGSGTMDCGELEAKAQEDAQ